MGLRIQFACATMVALFAVALFVTTSLFVEARASRHGIPAAAFNGAMSR